MVSLSRTLLEKDKREKKKGKEWKGLWRIYTRWKNSIKWIKNWCFLCSLKDVIIVIKSGKNSESHVGKEIDDVWLYMLMSWILGWVFGICGLGLLVQITIFYYFNF